MKVPVAVTNFQADYAFTPDKLDGEVRQIVSVVIEF